MKLLEMYVEDVNTFPKLKSNKISKLLDKALVKFALISFAGLLLKFSAEYLVEAWIK